MPKLNPWQALVALALLIAVPVVLVETGHKTDLGFVVAGVSSLVLAVLNVFKQPPPSGPSVPPLASAALMVCMLLAIDAAVCACGAPSAPTAVTLAGAECVSHRTALQLACVDTYADASAIDDCRARVRATIECVSTPDAGADQ